MFMGLSQAAGLLLGCFPLQEVVVLTDRAAIYDYWDSPTYHIGAGYDCYQSFCWEVVGARPHTTLREIGRS